MPPLALRRLDDLVNSQSHSEPTYLQIAPEIEQPVAPPAFLLGDLPAELSYSFFSETKTGPVQCYRLHDVSLTVDGIVMADGGLHWTTLLNHPEFYVQSLITTMGEAILKMPSRRVSGPAVMFSAPGSHIYGHWLVDILPRLYVLECCGYDLRRLKFIISAALPNSSREMLRQLGIGQEQLVIHDEQRETLQVDDLLLPSNLRRGSRMHPLLRQAANMLRKQLLPPGKSELPRAPHRKLFISRMNTDPSRSMLNREEIEQIAVREGFELIFPERLSIAEQIELFGETQQIAGEYGSGLHNSIFMPMGAVVTAIRGTSHHPGFIQSALAQVFQQPTGYVLCPTPIAAVHQSFTVVPDAFRLGLRCAGLLARNASDLAGW